MARITPEWQVKYFKNEKNLLKKAKDLNEELRTERAHADELGGRDREGAGG